MGHARINYLKKEAKEGEDRVVFKKLEAFYKHHPHATQAVKKEVEEIRKEFEAATDALQRDFEAAHRKLTAKYLQIELDYLESWLSPDDKVGMVMSPDSRIGKFYRFLKKLRSKFIG